MSEQKMREALSYIVRRLQADIDDGSRPDQWTMEDIVGKCESALSQRETQEPVGYVNSQYLSFLASGQGYSSVIRSKFACENDRVDMKTVTPLYAAPPSREVPEEWRTIVERLTGGTSLYAYGSAIHDARALLAASQPKVNP